MRIDCVWGPLSSQRCPKKRGQQDAACSNLLSGTIINHAHDAVGEGFKVSGLHPSGPWRKQNRCWLAAPA
jgi:hypothetical protein